MTHHKEVPKKEPPLALTHVRVRARVKFDHRYRCYACGPLPYELSADDEKCRECGCRTIDYDHLATIDLTGRGGAKARLLVRESDAQVFLRDLGRVLGTVFHARLVETDPDDRKLDAFHDGLDLCDVTDAAS